MAVTVVFDFASEYRKQPQMLNFATSAAVLSLIKVLKFRYYSNAEGGPYNVAAGSGSCLVVVVTGSAMTSSAGEVLTK